jgi:hypothetical protein
MQKARCQDEYVREQICVMWGRDNTRVMVPGTQSTESKRYDDDKLPATVPAIRKQLLEAVLTNSLAQRTDEKFT